MLLTRQVWGIVLAIGAGTMASRAADPATQPASQPTTAPTITPATAAASMPATAPALEPKAVVELFLVGIFSGDEKAVFDNMTFVNDDALREAQAIVGEAIAQQQLDTTLAMAFDKTPDGEGGSLEQKRQMIDALRKQIIAAAITEMDDAAQVAVTDGPTIHLVRVGGIWKIDFDKTQSANQGHASKAAVAETAAHVRVYKQMTSDVRAGKFRTPKEANDELIKRLAQLPPAGAVVEAPVATDPKRKRALVDISNLKTALSIFKIDNDRYPTTAEGLAALTKQPAGLDRTWHKYMEALPKDPWGNDYVYRTAGDRFDIISPGADGKVGTDDDLNQFSK